MIDDVENAVLLFNANRIEEAKALLRNRLKTHQQDHRALYNLGSIFFHQSEFRRAAQMIVEAIKTYPAGKQYWLSLIECYFALGEITNAIRLTELVKIVGETFLETNQIQNKLNKELRRKSSRKGDAAPDFENDWSAAQVKGFLASNNSWNRCVVTLYNLGKAAKKKNKEDIAKLYFHRAIACVDLDPDVMAELSAIYVKTDRSQAMALATLSVKLYPRYGRSLSSLGLVQEADGQVEAAIKSYERAVRVSQDLQSLLRLCTLYYQSGRHQSTLNEIKRFLSENAETPDLLNILALTQESLCEREAALATIEKALTIKNASAELHNTHGTILKSMNKHTKALAAYQKAVDLEPSNHNSFNNIGLVYQELGKFKFAKEAFQKALELKPIFPIATYNFSRLHKYRETDIDLSNLRKIKQHNYKSKLDQILTYFTLAKAHDDLKKYEEAFNYYCIANRLRKADIGYDRNEEEKLFTQLKRLNYSPIDQKLLNQSDGIIPIFIVSLPRSGSTLIEGLLNAHKNICSAGELENLSKIILESKVLNTGWDSKKGHEIRSAYLNQTVPLYNGKKFLIDKMPLNLCWLGVIRSALPEAKIIYLVREPRAVCWSNFKHYYTDRGNGFCYDMDDMVNYHNLCTDWANYFVDKFGTNSIITIKYEDLIIDVHKVVKKLADFCGFPFEEKSLTSYRRRGVIKTASLEQARKKIYSGSNLAWENYKPFLRESFDKLR